ncbi:unnamed protein product [Closterium sp. NIES-64]|nr:unnamed protein product [Closterium sp. NIES-64]
MAAPRRPSLKGAAARSPRAAGLLPVLVLALLLQAPSASARHWFWNDGLFPVAAKPATLTAAESDGPAEVAAGQPVSAVPAPAPAAPAPAPAPAVSCHDAPLNGFIAAGAAPDPCAALAAELNRTAGKLGTRLEGKDSLLLLSSARATPRSCSGTVSYRHRSCTVKEKDCDVEDLLSIANAFDNHYVYKHIAVDSPDQTNLPSSIDIVADLRKNRRERQSGKVPSLVDAHMAAFRATNALNDGHSAFHPTCFGGSSYDLPLPLMAVVENGQQIIRVAPRRCGMDRDRKPDCFHKRHGILGDVLCRGAIKQCTLTALARTQARSDSMDTDMQQTTPVIYKFLKRHPDPVYYDDTSDGSGNLNVEIASLSAAAAATALLVQYGADCVYLHGQQQRPVIWLHHASVTDIKDDVMDQRAFPMCSPCASPCAPHVPPPSIPSCVPASNASQVIIDVRGNGGGSTVASYTAIRLLMGAAKVPDASFTMPMDFIIGSQYTENAIGLLAVNAASLYFIDAILRPQRNESHKRVWLRSFPRAPLTAAGPAGNYSAPFKMTDRFTGKERQPVFGGRPFLVLSDGNCFSACAILTHVLGKRHKVPMVTVGGLPNQPPDVGSSCLGQHHINYTVDLIDKPWAMWNEVAKLFGSAAA